MHRHFLVLVLLGAALLACDQITVGPVDHSCHAWGGRLGYGEDAENGNGSGSGGGAR